MTIGHIQAARVPGSGLHSQERVQGLFDAYARKDVAPEGAYLEVLDLGTERLIDRRVGDRGDGHLLLEALLGLLVKDGALLAISDGLGFLDQLVVLRVAPHGVVIAAAGVATVTRTQPVVRFTVVAGPTDPLDVVFAILGTL